MRTPMDYADLTEFVTRGRAAMAHGPVALLFAEDSAALDATLAHNRRIGFRHQVLFAPDGLALPDIADDLSRVRYPTMAEDAVPAAVNAVLAAAPEGTWFYYGFNAEFLFFPFCDSRTVGELLTFHAEERRDAMLTYVIDLYARDLETAPNAVSLDAAHLDRTGYYALQREDPDNHWQPMDRQLDFYGGLRWRFEEHIPHERRRIDRIALFRASKGLRLNGDHTFNVAEYNTFACPWHHNLTAAVCSFRTAKALRSNPGSRAAISTFHWQNSVPFRWEHQQLLDLGLMEPGQWF